MLLRFLLLTLSLLGTIDAQQVLSRGTPYETATYVIQSKEPGTTSVSSPHVWLMRCAISRHISMCCF